MRNNQQNCKGKIIDKTGKELRIIESADLPCYIVFLKKKDDEVTTVDLRSQINFDALVKLVAGIITGRNKTSGFRDKLFIDAALHTVRLQNLSV